MVNSKSFIRTIIARQAETPNRMQVLQRVGKRLFLDCQGAQSGEACRLFPTRKRGGARWTDATLDPTITD